MLGKLRGSGGGSGTHIADTVCTVYISWLASADTPLTMITQLHAERYIHPLVVKLGATTRSVKLRLIRMGLVMINHEEQLLTSGLLLL